jgi:hypothetical protein
VLNEFICAQLWAVSVVATRAILVDAQEKGRKHVWSDSIKKNTRRKSKICAKEKAVSSFDYVSTSPSERLGELRPSGEW